jgi:hypothetical protein
MTFGTVAFEKLTRNTELADETPDIKIDLVHFIAFPGFKLPEK